MAGSEKDLRTRFATRHPTGRSQVKDCPSDPELVRWQKSGLPTEREDEITEHITTCPKCGPRAVELELLGGDVAKVE